MILLSNLSKSFGTNRLFDELSFSLDRGVYCLGGPSGCGKTTLGRILVGLEKADGGTVSGVVGHPVILFQEQRLLPSISALRNVSSVSKDKDALSDAATLLKRLGFSEEDMDKHPNALSGGMQQRVAIARALLFAKEYEGNLALLDEPFRGLDPDMKAVVADMIREELADRAVLVITHDESDASLLCGKWLPFFGSPSK